MLERRDGLAESRRDDIQCHRGCGEGSRLGNAAEKSHRSKLVHVASAAFVPGWKGTSYEPNIAPTRPSPKVTGDSNSRVTRNRRSLCAYLRSLPVLRASRCCPRRRTFVMHSPIRRVLYDYWSAARLAACRTS